MTDKTTDADFCKFFGEPWPSGICDDGRRVPTPVGKVCNLCREIIEADHRGSFVNCLDGQGFAQPVHRECSLRSVVGGIGHLEDCAKWCGELHAPDGGRSYRKSALEVWERIKNEKKQIT